MTRYPASLHLAVQRAVGEAIASVVAKHPHRRGPEMTVAFYPLPSLATGEGDETPLLSGAEVSDDE